LLAFSKIEPSYTSKDGCRLIWKGDDEDDQHVVLLGKDELAQLVEIFEKNSTGTIVLEDQVSSILVNSDVTQFQLRGFKTLEVKTTQLQEQVLDYAKVPHEPQYIHIHYNLI